MQPDPIDVAMTLLAHLGGTVAYSREFDAATLHAIELTNYDVPIYLAEPHATGAEDLVAAGAWIGAEIGTFPCSAELYRLLADSPAVSEQLATFPGLVRSGRVRLWRREQLDAQEMSLRYLDATIRRLVDDAHNRRTFLAKALAVAAHEPRPSDDTSVDEVLGRIDVDLRAGGHDDPWPFWLWTNSDEDARLMEDSEQRRWSVGRDGWVAPVFTTDPSIAGDFLRLRYPPDCLNGLVADHKTLLYGAIGCLAMAVEDHYDPALALLKLLCGHHQPTLLDAVAGHLALAAKGGAMFEQVMPHGPFGWARPFVLVGSSVTGQGEAHTWDPAAGNLRPDPEVTAVWRDLIGHPANTQAVTRLLDLLGDRFEQLTHPQSEREAPMSDNGSSVPDEIIRSLDELAVAAPVRDLVVSLAGRRSLTTDGIVSSYVGVRPSSNGTISVYVHSHSVSLALEPDVARRAAERLGGSLRAKNPTTWFLRLSAEELAVQQDDAMRLAELAIDKSEAGPAYEGGRDAAAALVAAPAICPRCRQYELAANGSCVCD